MSDQIRTMNQAGYAKHRGVSRKTVTGYKQQGRLVIDADGRVDVAASDRILNERPENYRGGVTKGNNTGVGKQRDDLQESVEATADRIINDGSFVLLSKAEAEAKKENYLALLRQLEYDRESGSVVAVADVAQKVANEYALVRNRLLSIPSRVAPRIAVIKSPEEVKAILESEISQALQELACDADQIKP